MGARQERSGERRKGLHEASRILSSLGCEARGPVDDEGAPVAEAERLEADGSPVLGRGGLGVGSGPPRERWRTQSWVPRCQIVARSARPWSLISRRRAAGIAASPSSMAVATIRSVAVVMTEP